MMRLGADITKGVSVALQGVEVVGMRRTDRVVNASAAAKSPNIRAAGGTPDR